MATQREVFQRQIDTRAIELAQSAKTEVAALKDYVSVSVDGLKEQIASNRRTRDEQHASAEMHFKVIYGKFDHLARWHISTAGAVILLLIAAVGVLIEPALIHHGDITDARPADTRGTSHQ